MGEKFRFPHLTGYDIIDKIPAIQGKMDSRQRELEDLAEIGGKRLGYGREEESVHH